MYQIIIWSALFLLSSIGLFTDLKFRKIPNKINLIFIILGFILNSVFFGFKGVGQSIVGIIIPFILLLPFYSLRGIGAGDVKFFMAIGAFVGGFMVCYIFATSFIIAGIYCAFRIISKRGITDFKNIIYSMNILLFCGLATDIGFDKTKVTVFRLSPAIFLGVIICFIFSSLFPMGIFLH